eukprot:scaffold34271_cov73-Phaeocystis_antarctica.AAC.2
MRQLLSIALTAQRRAHRLQRLSVPPPAHARSTSYRRGCVYHRPFMSRGTQRRSRKATLASPRGRQAGVGAARARSLLCTWCAWMVGLFPEPWVAHSGADGGRAIWSGQNGESGLRSPYLSHAKRAICQLI